jgi:hypothetical protein
MSEGQYTDCCNVRFRSGELGANWHVHIDLKLITHSLIYQKMIIIVKKYKKE